MSRRSWVLVAAVCSVSLIACSSGEGDPEGSTPAPSEASSTAASTPSPSAEPASNLPEPLDLDDLGAQTLSASPFPDWVLVAYDRAWVGGVGPGIGVYDAVSGDNAGRVSVPEGQCASMGAGFGSVWTATCTEPGVSRIDPETAKVTAHVSVTEGITSESSVGVGAGGVWVLTDVSGSCIACRLVGIDPSTMETSVFEVPEDAGAVRAGLGGVWITYPTEDLVRHIAPESGEVVGEIAVGSGPLFLDVGAGGVWVMNQGDGSVSHIDPATEEATTIVVDPPSIGGGDIAVGEQAVWVRVTGVLVARIDPKTDEVTDRYGTAGGSGSADAGNGMLWISAHDVGAVYRVSIT